MNSLVVKKTNHAMLVGLRPNSCSTTTDAFTTAKGHEEQMTFEKIVIAVNKAKRT